jgi:hypothetical protein
MSAKKYVNTILAVVLLAIFNYGAFNTEQTILAVLGLAILVGLFMLYFNRNGLRRFSDIAFIFFPIFWIAGGTVLIFLLEADFFRIVASAFVSYFLFRIMSDIRPKTHSALVDNAFFLSATGIFLGLWAADFFFSPAWWIIIALHFAFTFLFFWTGLSTALVGNYDKLLYSLILALVFAELTWAMLFWPLHFLSLTVVSAALFYSAWSLFRFYLSGSLDRKKIIFYTVFSSVVIIVVFSTAIWLPTT